MDFTLNATSRDVIGKGASRRLRREENLVPGIVYGGKHAGKARKPQSISMKANELNKAIEEEAFFSQIVTLTVDDKAEQVLVKDIQRHVFRPEVLHIDFMRVNKNTKIKAHVPVHFLNEDTCVGVKTHGGLISHLMTSIDVLCNAGDLPEFIEIDLAEADLGTIVHLSDVKYPKGVESLALTHGSDHDATVVSVNAPKRVAATEEEAEGGEEAPAAE